jgi:hypothetical protein
MCTSTEISPDYVQDSPLLPFLVLGQIEAAGQVQSIANEEVEAVVSELFTRQSSHAILNEIAAEKCFCQH